MAPTNNLSEKKIEEENLLTFYETQIIRQQELLTKAQKGIYVTTSVRSEQLIALIRHDLSILTNTRDQIQKNIDEIKSKLETTTKGEELRENNNQDLFA